MEVHSHLHTTVRDGGPVVGQGVRFKRIRRITGYAEERDRVKHFEVFRRD